MGSRERLHMEDHMRRALSTLLIAATSFAAGAQLDAALQPRDCTTQETIVPEEILQRLEPYRDFLEWGTYVGQDWSHFSVLPLSRYQTFRLAFRHFLETQGRVVVELGTSRSFVHGGHPGCNSSDPQ